MKTSVVFDSSNMIIQVARHLENVCKLRSLAILMEMSCSDWDYVRLGWPPREKRVRLAELWVKKHREDSLRLLVNILMQPAMAEQRIAQQISRGFSHEASEIGITAPESAVEVDGPRDEDSFINEEKSRMKRYMTKQDALNHLSGYPSQWEEIGKNLIDSSEVDKIINDVEAKGDEAAYIVEKWWSVTTEEDGGFSWEKLEDAIEKLGPTHEKPTRSRVARALHCLRRMNDNKFVDAAKRGNLQTVRHFLEDVHHDPNTPKPNNRGWTALMWACKRGHLDIVKLLLRHKASPNKVGKHGFSPLMLACKYGHYEVVRILLDNEEKLDVNAVSQENGWTALILASRIGSIEIVKALCQMDGININHQSHDTWSALTIACSYGREDIVKVLVDAGADINLKKKGGVTALHIACYKGLIKAMKHIVPPHGRCGGRVNINVADDWRMTPLMLAIKGGHFELTKYLVLTLRAQVNILAEKYNQWSAIFFAIRNRDLDTVHLLMDCYADTVILDEYANSSLDVAWITKKKLYKQLKVEERERSRLEQAGLNEEEEVGGPTRVSVPQTLFYNAKYCIKEMVWRRQQRPLLVCDQ